MLYCFIYMTNGIIIPHFDIYHFNNIKQLDDFKSY